MLDTPSLDQSLSTNHKYRCVSLSRPFDATNIVPVLLLCSGTIADLFSLTYTSNSSLQVSNLAIRFIWLSYIFLDGVNADLWAFIAALLEMLRRVQWNFCMLSLFFVVMTEVLDGVQIDSRTSTWVIWISARSRARYHCRTGLTCAPTRRGHKAYPRPPQPKIDASVKDQSRCANGPAVIE